MIRTFIARCGLIPALLATGLAVLWTDAAAAPGEVTGLQFTSKASAEWVVAPGAAGYHVYRGSLATLATDSGDCFVGSVQGTASPLVGDPPPGTGYFYIVSAYDASSEGSLGAASNGTPRIPSPACIPARRHLALVPNGPAADGVVDGDSPRRNPSVEAWPGVREDVGVLLHSGEFVLSASDLSLRGRGIDFHLARNYRSQILHDGPLGHGWDFNLNARLAPVSIDLAYHDGSGRRELFVRDLFAPFFLPVRGLYGRLKENPDGSFILRYADGTLQRFHAIDGSSLQGALERIEDRAGNFLSLRYDHQGLLQQVVDTLGRVVTLGYNPAGRIASVTDFSGRAWLYTYDPAGNLATVRTPVVVGTPNGNDFPTGKTTTYGYAGGADPKLAHNLLTVRAPREGPLGVAHIVNTYGAAGPNVDRVTSQTIGGTNASGIPAGGALTFTHAFLNAGAPPDLSTPRRQITVLDRAGNRRVDIHNFHGNRIQSTEETNRNVRPAEGDYVSSWQYNGDGEVTRLVRPEGNELHLTYDRPGADRYREGDLLVLQSIADPDRGDGRGGASNPIIETFVYEPVFNRLKARTDPRGNEPGYVPQNGGATSPARYRTTWTYDYEEGDAAANGIDAYLATYEINGVGKLANLGDVNGDGRTDQAEGLPVRIEEPAVTLDVASDQAGIEGDTQQEARTLIRWNDAGLPASFVDPEKNVTVLSYFPENDPDGNGVLTPSPPDGRVLSSSPGGYESGRTVDAVADPLRNNQTNPVPRSVVFDYRYDPVGHRTHVVDGRGVRTRSVFNALDQVVEVREASATATAASAGETPTGRGEPDLPAFGFVERFEYDANDALIARRLEDRDQDRGVGPFVDTTYQYDVLDRQIRTSREATVSTSLVTDFRYDPNENRIQTIKPEGNVDATEFDERDLLFRQTRGASGPRGGTPSSSTFGYDGNRNLVHRDDPRGKPSDVTFDGHDRPVRELDPIGGRIERFFDPASSMTRMQVVGTPGGPSPTVADRNSPPNNVLLVDETYLHDERRRRFGHDRNLIAPLGTTRAPVLVEGSLIPADGKINRRLEYDKLSRTTFVHEDSSAETRIDWDGASQEAKRTLPDGSLVRSTYDAGGNLVETIESELPASDPPAVDYLTTSSFDSLGRRTTRVDNVGRTWRWGHDSLGRTRATSDPQGPLQGTTIFRRSPGQQGQSVPVNEHGNVIRYTYDGAGRHLTSIRILQPGGTGTGSLDPPRDTSNPFNADGEITATTVWDDNGLATSTLDDRGNTTDYLYDNLDRRTRMTADDGTFAQYAYDAADHLVQHTDARSSVLTHTLDDAGRKVSTDVTLAPSVIGTTHQEFEYDGLRRLTKAHDENVAADPNDDVTDDYFYDSLGRLIEERQDFTDPAFSPQAVDYVWEADTRLTSLVYPTGRRVDYDYDAADRLIRMEDVSASRNEYADFTYAGPSRLATIARENGVTTALTWDSARLMTRMQHAGASLADFEYGRDRAGRPLYERRFHAPGTVLGLKGEQYTYDSAGRLVTFREGDLDPGGNVATPEDQQTWTLDGEANWVEMTRNGTTYTATPNNLNEYDEMQSGGTRVDDGVPDDFRFSPGAPERRNHGHDKNGSLVVNADASGTSDEYRYDAFQRLVEIHRNGSLLARYKWDALGRRVKRVVTGGGDFERYVYASAGKLGSSRRLPVPDARQRKGSSGIGGPWDWDWLTSGGRGGIGGPADWWWLTGGGRGGIIWWPDEPYPYVRDRLRDSGRTEIGGPADWWWLTGGGRGGIIWWPDEPYPYVRDRLRDSGRTGIGGPADWWWLTGGGGRSGIGGPADWWWLTGGGGRSGIGGPADWWWLTGGGGRSGIGGPADWWWLTGGGGRSGIGGPADWWWLTGGGGRSGIGGPADWWWLTGGGGRSEIGGPADWWWLTGNGRSGIIWWPDEPYPYIRGGTSLSDNDWWEMFSDRGSPSLLLEERNANDSMRRMAVLPAGAVTGSPDLGMRSTSLWQFHPIGTSVEWLYPDGRGGLAAITQDASQTVQQRVTYDAYGVPTFENASNQKLCDVGGVPQPCVSSPPGSPFLGDGTFDAHDLWRGMRYDPEAGTRTSDPRTDYGGFYVDGDFYYTPTEGRSISRLP